MHIAFIGLGVMGAPMARNLLASGAYTVSLFDRVPHRAQALVGASASCATSIADAVATAQVVMTSLPGPQQLEAVAFAADGLLAHMRRGAVWIELSTNSLQLCRRLLPAVAARGLDWLDAPVSGGDEGARAGNLSILVGGDAAVFARYRPLLQVLGERIIHVGPGGAGYIAKTAQVLLCYLHSLALSEALMLGSKGGVDPAEMLSIIQQSTGRSYVAERYGPPILRGDYDASFSLGLALKDLELAQQLAATLKLKLPMTELTAQTYAAALDTYGFDANHLKAIALLERDNDLQLRGECLEKSC